MLQQKIFIPLLFTMLLTVTHISAQASTSTAIMEPVSLETIHQMARAAKSDLETQAHAENHPVKLYLHWSAGHYGTFYDAYHINIDADGTTYVSTRSFSEVKPHTYRRNSGSIGISLACAYGARPDNLGFEPPTDAQVDRMAQTIAVLADALAIPIDREHVLTHGEAGDNEDKLFPNYEDNGRPYGMYGPFHGSERWDLAILKNGAPWLSGGNTLRFKAQMALLKLQKPHLIFKQRLI